MIFLPVGGRGRECEHGKSRGRAKSGVPVPWSRTVISARPLAVVRAV